MVESTPAGADLLRRVTALETKVESNEPDKELTLPRTAASGFGLPSCRSSIKGLRVVSIGQKAYARAYGKVRGHEMRESSCVV